MKKATPYFSDCSLPLGPEHFTQVINPGAFASSEFIFENGGFRLLPCFYDVETKRGNDGRLGSEGPKKVP